MHMWLLTALIILAALPSPAFSESWEDFQKLKGSDEKTGLIPKGGPRLIPKDVIVEGLKKDCEVTFRSDALLFNFGSAILKPESLPNLQSISGAIVQALGDPELSKITTYYVDGHTCAIGSEENNCRLSWMRGQAVVDELVKLGVPREKLAPRGYGKAHPSHSNDTEATRSMNRRVVLQGDCPGKAASVGAPCERKVAGEPRTAQRTSQRESSSASGSSEPVSERIDTTELDEAIADLHATVGDAAAPVGIGIPLPLPIPLEIMIPMGKDAAQKTHLPPGFQRTTPAGATPQAAQQSGKMEKSPGQAQREDPRDAEGKAKTLPPGFKKSQ